MPGDCRRGGRYGGRGETGQQHSGFLHIQPPIDAMRHDALPFRGASRCLVSEQVSLLHSMRRFYDELNQGLSLWRGYPLLRRQQLEADEGG